MSVKNIVQEAALSPKFAGGVAAMTTTSGVGTWFNWIPDDIGKLTALVGLLLSFLLIKLHLSALRKSNLELEIMRLKEAERKRIAMARREGGESVRRSDDFMT